MDQLAERYGLKRSTLASRLRKGMTLEEALTTPKRETMTYVVDGERLTVRQLAQRHGLREATLRKRLSQGEPMEQALRPTGRRK